MLDSTYLAMTAAEIYNVASLPKKLAYMACHFSSYGTGLSNLPNEIPADTVLILNDRTPIFGHDENLIAQQLQALVTDFSCPYILLDFQRQNQAYTPLIAKLVDTFSHKIIISQLYAKPFPCPVLLQPLPVGCKLEKHIAPWQNRELWLDLSCETALIRVTVDGSQRETLSYQAKEDLTLHNKTLHCSYTTTVKEDCAEFLLSRTSDHLPALIAEAKSLGIAHFIGLYQQLHNQAPRE